MFPVQQLFAPVNGPSAFSRMHNAQTIMTANAHQRVDIGNMLFTHLVRAVVLDRGEGEDIPGPQCVYQ